MTLKCPPGTSISVELAQYDKSGVKNSQCPSKLSTSEVKNSSCTWPTAIQNKWEEMTKGTWGRYSLLQTVVEACQKKKSCKFQASPKSFDGDLCPGERKYVEVAYKCRPYEFRSRVACENERVQVQCNPNSRVAIYSASYGRTEYESFQCPQPQGVAEETCLVSYATETVMQLCHGKRQCEFGADASTFGNPCRPQTKMYLRIVYTCVPQKVLNSEYEEPLGEDETEQDFTYDQEDFDGFDSTKERIREFAASPGSTAPNMKQIYKQNETNNENSLSGNTSSSAHGPFNKNPQLQPGTNSIEENTYIYLLLTLGAASLLCVIIITSRALVRRHHEVPASIEAKFQATSNNMSLDMSTPRETELNTPLPMHHAHTHGYHDPDTESLNNQIPRVHVHNTCTMTDGYFYG
ncbi:uncharacterized protein [Atheta coriaria]